MNTNVETSPSGTGRRIELRTVTEVPGVQESNANQANLELLVKGPQLLEMLFTPESRPSMQWLRAQVKAKSIPYLKRGRLVFFRPRTVLDFFAQREVRPTSMRRLQ